jgi:hypothetical protein
MRHSTLISISTADGGCTETTVNPIGQNFFRVNPYDEQHKNEREAQLPEHRFTGLSGAANLFI